MEFPLKIKRLYSVGSKKLNEGIQGTGLGLPICKLIINRMGGDIWVDSTYSKGACFIFYSPFETGGKPMKRLVVLLFGLVGAALFMSAANSGDRVLRDSIFHVYRSMPADTTPDRFLRKRLQWDTLKKAGRWSYWIRHWCLPGR